MKVVLLSPLPPPTGGIAGWTERMQLAKLKNGWEVSVVDEKLTNTDLGKKQKPISWLISEIKRCINIWSNLAAQVKEKDVKVVQACIPSYTGSLMRELVSLFITHCHRKKFIIHFRCTVPNATKGIIGNFLLKKMCCHSDYVFVLNKQSLEYISRLCAKSNTLIKVIPNFVSIDETKYNKVYKNEIKTIIYTGRIYEDKGCRDIIEVARRCPEFTFKLVGKIAMEIDELPDNVIMTGELQHGQIGDELKQADVFIFLSYYRGEGFSNSLAEAMGYGLPCIVTDWAANADMIENKGGYVVNRIAYDEIVELLYKLNNPELRKLMGEWNKKKVVECYNEMTITDKYVGAYDILLNS